MNNVSINGVITPTEQAVVSVMDHGFLYGMGLFETFRTYRGRPFLLDKHMRRLQAGCQSLGIQWNETADQVCQQIAELMQANQLAEAYIRYTVSAGEDILGLPSGPYTQPTIVIYAKPLPPALQGNTQERLSGKSKALRRLHTVRNTPEGDIRFKSLHYMNSILGKRELSLYNDQPSTSVEGLMLTAEGHLAEGIVSNLFFVQDDCLYTPSVDTGILPGITRSYIMKLAEKLELPVEKGLYNWQQLQRADEIFMTNSIQELVPINVLLDDDHEIPVSGGQPGRWTTALYEAYEKEACQP
ncbi:aminodeoxychorismate lyase [Paenibacillus sp. WLX2291]|uniref:aminodeoxychorismate lyase n=1 Tax=Paenibacillus sp. WLX2291 TaxID=3296934 RepID=UPI003984114B